MSKNVLRIIKLLGSVVAISGAIVLSSLDKNVDFTEERTFIALAGEDFEHVCDPKVKVQFDDEGYIDIKFESAKKDEVIWVKVADKCPFDWEVQGNIGKFNNTGKYAEEKQGFKDNLAIFRVSIDSAAKIRIKSSKPVHSTLYHVAVRTPFIYGLFPSEEEIDDRNKRIQNAINGTNKEELDKYSKPNAITEELMTVGKVGEYKLLPAMAHISVRYLDTAYYKEKYNFKAEPDGYYEDTLGASWENSIDLFPIVEYDKENCILLVSKLVNILYTIGFFLISELIIEGIESLFDRKTIKRGGKHR